MLKMQRNRDKKHTGGVSRSSELTHFFVHASGGMGARQDRGGVLGDSGGNERQCGGGTCSEAPRCPCCAQSQWSRRVRWAGRLAPTECGATCVLMVAACGSRYQVSTAAGKCTALIVSATCMYLLEAAGTDRHCVCRLHLRCCPTMTSALCLSMPACDVMLRTLLCGSENTECNSNGLFQEREASRLMNADKNRPASDRRRDGGGSSRWSIQRVDSVAAKRLRIQASALARCWWHSDDTVMDKEYANSPVDTVEGHLRTEVNV